ncbi:MAG: hypothetical protein EBU49_03645 [Proteobacteria bacterium]|nr:hypothetical protein [Pseudomonadota bacterium]
MSFASSAMAQSTQDALRLDLTQDGLDAVAREIQSRFMHDIDSREINNIHRILPDGWVLDTQGLEYSVDFKKLNLKATREGIHVDFAVDGVRLHADSIKVSKPWLWWNLKSKCTGVDVNVSGPTELALSVLLMPVVTEAGTLDADLRGLEFSIDPEGYVVRGPTDCSGVLGFGGYMRDAVAGVLAGAREQVADIVRQQVLELLPEAVAEIDGMLHQSFELHVGYPGVPFSEDLLLAGAPSGIEVHEGRLVFLMSSEVSAALKEGSIDSGRKERNAKPVPPGIIFGSVGLNKKVINDALEALHPMAQRDHELKPDLIPQLGQYFDTTMLASVWPDLNELKLDTTEVRVFISCPGLPSVESFSADAPEGAARAVKFAVQIPDARLSIMVKSDGSWMDYANINVRLSVPLAIDMEDGEMEVRLNDVAVVGIGGGWAAGYKPSVDIFEADLAQVIVKSVFDMVFLQGPFLRLLVPVYDFGGGRMGFSNPQTNDPYFSVDLVSAKR